MPPDSRGSTEPVGPPALAAQPWNAREQAIYEIGYRDGESNHGADWNFALSEYCDLPEGVEPWPTQIAAYIDRLQAELKGANGA